MADAALDGAPVTAAMPAGAGRPLAIDLFCGLGGWTGGLIAEGWRVRGYDIEAHEYWAPEDIDHAETGSKGTKPIDKRGWAAGCAITMGVEGPDAKPRTRLLRYPAELVLQDVLTINGADFADAQLICASPPCQFFSYTAMPWSKAKALAAAVRADPERLAKELALFNACFRIQREASEAAGRHIPLIVENVRGAIPWVGRSRWSYGSFHLWGDVPALMPVTLGRGIKAPGMNWSDHTKRGQDFTRLAGQHTAGAIKVPSDHGRRTDKGNGARFTNRDCGIEVGRHAVNDASGTKNGNDWFGAGEDCSAQRRHGSKSPARKMASAMIAKIPQPLARHIAATFYPRDAAIAAE